MVQKWVGAATVVIIIGSGIALNGRQTVPATAVTASYDDFVRLDAKQRRLRFGHLSAENRATLLRTHAEGWLAKNRGRLSASEVAVFQEAIAFVSPEIFQKPLDPRVIKKQQDVQAKFRCRVDPADVSAAFDLLGQSAASTQSRRWSYLTQAKCWIAWFAESVVDFLPASKPAR